MIKCRICDEPITDENQSLEHIIPNSIGGRLKSLNLVCQDCNNRVLGKYDAQLAKSFELFSNTLDIKRERGKAKPIKGTHGDEDYLLDSKGKPTLLHPIVEKTAQGEAVNIKIKANNEKEARKVLNGLKRSYPDLDIDEIMKKSQAGQEYFDTGVKINFVMGGEDAFRSIAKIAYLFTAYSCPEIIADFESIVKYLNGSDIKRHVYFYFPEKEVVNRDEFKAQHIISIKSYPEDGSLVGFVELFSSVSFIVLLSDDCSQEISASYVYDIMERKDETEDCPIIEENVGHELYSEIIEKQELPTVVYKERLERFSNYAGKVKTFQFFNQAAEAAVAEVFGKYEEGIPITKEMSDEFAANMSEKIIPLLLRNIKKRNGLIDD